MTILALDTATRHAALAIGRDDSRTFVAHPDPGPRHGRTLVPALRDLLDRAGLRPADLGAIAVGVGPGSFTGLRIGVMAAKVLAFATSAPLYALDSLEVLARNAPEAAVRVAVGIDAQRGEVFAADFARAEPGGSLVRLGTTRIESSGRWCAGLEPGTYVIGPPPGRLGLPWPPALILAEADHDRPDGARLLDLARAAVAAGAPAEPWFLEPVYLRRSAAEEKAGPGLL